MKTLNLLWLALILCCSEPPAFSQSNTVGNGSSIGPSAGELENYGINGLQSTQTRSPFPSRHHRLQGTGIGNSFIGTTSPTSEGTPATKLVIPIPPSMITAQSRLPKLDSTFPDTTNPATQSFTPALPALPRSSALSSPLSRPTSFDSTVSSSGVQNMPSLGGQGSLTDQLRFDSFNSFR